MTEHLSRNEKIRAFSKLMDEIENEGQEPFEMEDHEKFEELMESLCTDLITDVECIMHENEEQKARIEQSIEETFKSYEQCKYLML